MKLLTQDDEGYRELTWSRQPPTEPGWYLFSDKTPPKFVQVLGDRFNISGWSAPVSYYPNAYWLGPIPVPSPPKEEK